MELKVYLDFLRRRWWLLFLGPVIAGLAALFVTRQMTPVYQATATVLINRTTIPGTIEYNDILTSERLTNTYAELVERPAVLDAVKQSLSLDIDRRVLAEKIFVSPVRDTQLLNITAKDQDPAFAANLANTTAESFIDDNASQLSSPGTVSIAKPAETPAAPVSPKLLFNLAFAVALGGIAAAGLGLLLDYFDDTIKTSEDVEGVAGLPTLGLIGRFRPSTGPAYANELHSRTAEAYRELRTNVHFTALGSQLKTIVITSASPEEGKSTTAANLATVLAQAGDKVILVDTDLRRSSLQRTFDGTRSLGLTGLLLNDIHDPSLALVSTRWKNLRLLPAGMLPPNPSELLTSARMTRVIEQLRRLADYVIFDTPPVLAVTDAVILAARADGTILVAQAGRTRSGALREVAKALQQANVRAIGVVLNKAKLKHSVDYYYGDTQTKYVEVEAEPAALSPEAAAIEADASFVQAVDALRARFPNPEMAVVAHNGNGHGGLETAPLRAAMSDLMTHLDDTVGLIRSLRPGSRPDADEEL